MPQSFLTLGETMTLVTPVSPVPLEEAVEFRVDIGGAESNVASHLVRLGVPTMWASAVGDDPLGRRMLATLTRRGVDVSLVTVDSDAPTGAYFKNPGKDGTTVLYYRRDSAASRLGPDFAGSLPLHDAPMVHLTGITPALSDSCADLVQEIYRVRKEVGLPLSFDVNYRSSLWAEGVASEVLLDLARRADLVFVGRDEGENLWGTKTAEEISRLIGDKVRVIVKDGAVGAHHHLGGVEHFAHSHSVEVVEAVGAGDAFAAGFLAAESRGAPMTTALAAGHDSASRVLRSMGDF